MTIELNIDQILAEAESIGSPYSATTEDELNVIARRATRALGQLRAAMFAIDGMDGAVDAPQFANKAVRVSAAIASLENKLLVIEDARQDMAHAH